MPTIAERPSRRFNDTMSKLERRRETMIAYLMLRVELAVARGLMAEMLMAASQPYKALHAVSVFTVEVGLFVVRIRQWYPAFASPTTADSHMRMAMQERPEHFWHCGGYVQCSWFEYLRKRVSWRSDRIPRARVVR